VTLICDSADASDVECKDLKKTAKTTRNIQNNANDVKKKVDGLTGTTMVNRVAGFLTYGLVTAVAVKTVHGASGNSVKNLALGAGGAYTASTYFSPPTVESLYLAAHAELVCYASKGDDFIATYGAAKRDLDNKDVKPDIDILSPPECQRDGPVGNARTAMLEARASVDKAANMDLTLARALDTASNNVLQALNKQLFAQTPSIEAISKAGGVATAFASGLITQPGSAKATAPGMTPAAGNETKSTPACASISGKDAARMQRFFESIHDAMVKQINTAGDLSQGCTIAAALPPEPLAVNAPEVTLLPNQTFTAKVTGGRPNYYAVWDGVQPDPSHVTYSQPDLSGRLPITQGKDATDGEEFTLRIDDSSVIPTSVKVKVHLTKSKP